MTTADPFEGHFEHCYIREGAHCSCGNTDVTRQKPAMTVPLSDTRANQIRAMEPADHTPEEIGQAITDLWQEIHRLRMLVANYQGEAVRYDADHERLSAELRDRRTEDLNLRGLLAPDGLPRRVPMELGTSLVPAVDRLLTELDRFREGHRALFALMHDGQHWDGQRLVSEALLSQRDIRRALHWPPPVAPDGPCECKATADGVPVHQAAAPSSALGAGQ